MDRRIVAVASALVTGIAGLVLGIASMFDIPADLEPAELTCSAKAPPVPKGKALKVMVWNIQFAGSRKHHFFYDGGKAVHVPEADVRESLDRIAEVVREIDPDLILWQEIDRDSDRTHNIDQHRELLRRLPYPCTATAPYHRVFYVPTPSHEHMGRVDMNLAVYSRYKMTSATRIQLPLLDEPAWRRLFNLRRALLDVRLEVDDGSELRVFDTHLSAFSKGDGTLGKQMAVLDEQLRVADTDRSYWVLGGDLNALPPGDDPARLGPDAVWYADDESPVRRLFDRYESVVPQPWYQGSPEAWRTYLRPGATEPDRTLDYAFASRSVFVSKPEVVPVTDVSDHMPLVFEMTLE